MNHKRTSSRKRIGIVLSSGGVRGVYAHTGFLLALEKMGIDIQAVTGCSAGAVVGGIYASGANLQEWANVLKDIKSTRFWRPVWFRLLWSLLFQQGRGCTGFSSTDAAKEFCVEQLKVQTFEECEYPFHTLAVNVTTGQKTIFSEGSLASCMVASAAIPMLYQPVEIKGEFYSDGALIDLAPTDAICCHYNLDILIIHHVAQRSEGSNSLQQVMKQPWTMIEIMNRLLYRQRPWYLSDKPLTLRRCPCGCDALVIVIEPTLPTLEWPVTQNGFNVLHSARQQTDALLEPYLEVLKDDKEIGIEDINELESAFQATGCQT